MGKHRLSEISAVVLLIGFSLAACQNNTTNGDTPGTITYTVSEYGGDSANSTRAIQFFFSESIDGLGVSSADITVGGAAQKGGASFFGSGTEYTLFEIVVEEEGKATVKINKNRIEASEKELTVIYRPNPTIPLINITGQPNGITITEGAINESLSVEANITLNGAPYSALQLSYQWYSNTTESNTDGTVISGATSAIFNIPVNLSAADSPYYYYAVLSVSLGTVKPVSSQAVKVIVINLPTINTSNFTVSGNSKTYNRLPQNATVSYTGSGSAGAVDTSSAGEISVWYSGNSSAGTVYTESMTPPANAGTYDIKVTTAGGAYAPISIPLLLSARLLIEPVSLAWASGGTTANKVYDGTTTGAVATQPALDGVISGDTVTVVNGTLEFASANVGTNIAVSAAGFGIGGASAINYIAPAAQPAFTAANITIAPGQPTGAPTVRTKTATMIEVNAITLSGQTVEYAISTGTATPASGWQPSTTFSGLTSGVGYYLFARSMANSNYTTGTASRSEIVMTGNPTASPTLDALLVYHNYIEYGDGTSVIYTYDFSTNVRQVVNAPYEPWSQTTVVQDPMNAWFSPDGKDIVFMGICRTGSADPRNDSWCIYKYTLGQPGNPINLSSTNSRDEDPKYSSDGTKVYFKRTTGSQNAAFYELDMTQNPPTARRLTDHVNWVETGMPFPSPDGRYLVGHSIDWNAGTAGAHSIVVYTFATNNLASLPLYTYPLGGPKPYYPIAIDNERFYFTSHRSGSDLTDQIYIGYYDGRAPELLPFNNQDWDTSDACPVDDDWVITSARRSQNKGGYDLWIMHTNSDRAWSLDSYNNSINTDRHELGACLYLRK